MLAIVLKIFKMIRISFKDLEVFIDDCRGWRSLKQCLTTEWLVASFVALHCGHKLIQIVWKLVSRHNKSLKLSRTRGEIVSLFIWVAEKFALKYLHYEENISIELRIMQERSSFVESRLRLLWGRRKFKFLSSNLPIFFVNKIPHSCRSVPRDFFSNNFPFDWIISIGHNFVLQVKTSWP